MSDVHVLSAVRTPIGRYGGSLASVRADDLAALVLRSALDAVPALEHEQVDDVIFGAVNQAGEDNRNVARMAVLLAGLPVTVPGYTVNRLCGSGLQAVNDGVALIGSGAADVVVAGGTESMTRAPFVIPKSERPFSRHIEAYDTTIGWRLVNSRMPTEYTISMGEATELLADRYNISRDEQDAYALESHRRAVRAWEDGAFAEEIVPVEAAGGIKVERDEGPRADTTAEKLERLRPVFSTGGTVTAGNSSPLNDGAAAVVLASSAAVKRIGVQPLATVVGTAVAAVSPPDFAIGPVPAIRRALERAGRVMGDVDHVELNEAFAAQVLACNQELSIDLDRLNPLGGAIALGHPLGATGARLMTTMVHQLRRTGGRYGLQTMCEGGGMANATIVERV
jgi:acetyl-CoA acetyltransferase family protein